MRIEVRTLLNGKPSSPNKAKLRNLSITLTKLDLTRMSDQGALSKHKPNPKLHELCDFDETHPKPK